MKIPIAVGGAASKARTKTNRILGGRLARTAITAGAAGSLLLAAQTFAADQTVTIGPSLSFAPASVIVAPGETVTWVWTGASHSTTSDTTTGPEAWDSGIRSTGPPFSHTFSTPGTYPYYCVVHSFPGGTTMNGVVQVVAPPTPTPTPLSPTPTPGASAPATPVPALGGWGRASLAVALAAAGVLVLSFAFRR